MVWFVTPKSCIFFKPESSNSSRVWLPSFMSFCRPGIQSVSPPTCLPIKPSTYAQLVSGVRKSWLQCRPSSTSILTALLAIGALYAFALDRSNRVRVTAVCRFV